MSHWKTVVVTETTSDEELKAALEPFRECETDDQECIGEWDYWCP